MLTSIIRRVLSMPRKCKTTTVVEIRMSDGGWVKHPKSLDFKNIPDAAEWISERIRPGETMRVAKISGEYFIKQELIKR